MTPQRSLPTPAMLGFCDSVKVFRVEQCRSLGRNGAKCVV